MKRFIAVPFLLLTASAFTLETKPWYGEVYAFYFQGAYSFSRFTHVEGASTQLKRPLNNNDMLFNVGFTPTESIDLEMELEFGQTTLTNLNYRSVALQGRYRLLDDIAGDPISLVFGANVRQACDHFLTDVSTPYAAVFNAELSCSVGKEWSENGMWTMRTYGLATLGQANRGYPWSKQLFVWQFNVEDTHRFGFFAEGNVGFGNRQHVNVENFHGWGRFQHQSVDVGLSYGYKIGFYGVITAAYAHRVFAHNYPEHVNFFTLSYHLPFSLL